MDWLQLVIQGGALALLAVVLYGAWRFVQRLMDTLEEQNRHIRGSVAVQEQYIAVIDKLLAQLDMREKLAQERHAEMIDLLRLLNGSAVS